MKLPALEGSSDSRQLFLVHILTGTSIIKPMAQDVKAVSGSQEYQLSNWTQGVAGLQPVWVLSDYQERPLPTLLGTDQAGILRAPGNHQAAFKA